MRTDGGFASGPVGGLGAGTINASGTIRGAGFQDYSTGNQIADAGAGWLRSYNATGWYNGTYAGGWYMTDATFVRNYNYKTVLCMNGVTNNFNGTAGVQGWSTQYGVMGRGTGSGAAGGGYFDDYTGSPYAYVGYYNGLTSYKILGTGTVSTIVKDLDNKLVALHCPETPETYFQDFGEGKLNNGTVHITIDPVFSKNITVSFDILESL